MSALEPVIGLEVHAELLTRSKIFCACTAEFGGPPNTNVCPVCTGMPGVLPVLNRRVVEFAIRLGLATDCKIAAASRFARKNYFYPDLAKGYQISMYELPLCLAGHVDIVVDGTPPRLKSTRLAASCASWMFLPVSSSMWMRVRRTRFGAPSATMSIQPPTQIGSSY